MTDDELRKEVHDEVRRYLNDDFHVWRWRAVAIIWILFAIVVIYVVEQNRQGSRDGKIARTIQCAEKKQLRDRVRASVAFLSTHPNGFDSITADQIVQSIKADQDALSAFDRLSCPPPPAVTSVTVTVTTTTK